MAYKIRPGAVMLKICDSFILTATHDIWEDCRHVRPIPKMWAACWKIMEKGMSDEEAIEAFATLYGQPKEQIRGRYDEIFRTLFEDGFLIKDEEKEEPHE